MVTSRDEGRRSLTRRRVGVLAKRTLGAALAALLTLGVASAASAANTVAEELNEDDERPLAGDTRYETSLKIAEQMASYSELEIGRYVDTVVLVSGEGFADALSASALAGLYGAPILLTEPDELSRTVSRFINENDIRDVFIVGGTSAVSSAVANALEDRRIDVTRLAGSDRYATALAVAQHLNKEGGVGGYCGTNDTAVLIANGQSFADALAGGPLAYRGPHPVILTPGDSLPAGVEGYLTDAGIEKAIILGGTAAVSSSVADELGSQILDIVRWSGADRFDTAAMVLDELTDDPNCGFRWGAAPSDTDCELGPGRVALANSRSPFDALSGGPLLGIRGQGLLLVDQQVLPDASEQFLAATPRFVAGDPLHLKLDVLGGNAAVDPSVVNTAIAAAGEAAALSATITATPGTRTFEAAFSEEVDPDTAEDYRNYGVTAVGGALERLLSFDTLTYDFSDDAVTVELAPDSPVLAAGDTITVFGNEIRPYDHRCDQRLVPMTEHQIPVDRQDPRAELIVPTGGEYIFARLSETIHQQTSTGDVGGPVRTFNVTVRRPDENDYEVTLSQHADSIDPLLWSASDAVFAVGDQVTLPAGTLHDAGGNPNRRHIQVSVARQSPPRLAELSVSEPKHSQQAATQTFVQGLRFAIRDGSEHAGWQGNGWVLEFDADSTTNVGVNLVRRVIRIGIARSTSGGPVTLRDLLEVLDDDPVFTRHFEVLGRNELRPSDYEAIIRVSQPVLTFTGGETSVTVTAEWNQPILAFDESLTDVCIESCRNDRLPPTNVPRFWLPTERSAHEGDSFYVEWDVVAVEVGDELPTEDWSIIFRAGAITGFGDADAAEASRYNEEIIRRLRTR